jgi:hypothetical protein
MEPVEGQVRSRELTRMTGVGVAQSGDLPISSIFFWSIRTAICPEAYVHLKVSPGETASWTIRHRFYAR